MSDRAVLYRIVPALQGGFVTVDRAVESEASYVGVLSGANNVETALQRLDGTGVGAAITRFTGAFSATAANIDTWFGGRQLVRLRCIDSGTGPGVSGAVRFDLPGTAALTTAFDQLVTAGLPEQLTFVIEYTGAEDDFLQIFARTTGNPQIINTTSIIVRRGVAATLEVTRSSGTISDYTFLAIGAVGGESSLAAGSIRLINPTNAVWDASPNGPLPTSGVVQGNAYKVVNAPTDGSGRFGEVMQNDDWVVWEAEAFNSWSATPLNWFVIPGHDVRRITALEQDFLTDLEITPVSDRNEVIRGANYADSVAEIRLKIYPTRADYDPADLNTTGDIDEYTNPADITGFLGIRLPGQQATLASVLPTLYVYVEDASSNFTRLLNLSFDFSYEGDFAAESDYLALTPINYSANNTIRIYVGSPLDRYTSPSLDILESNLSDAVQAKLNQADGESVVDQQRLASLESKVAALFPLTPDVDRLNDWATIYTPENPTPAVVITDGYSLIADYRGDATRYESAGVTYDATGTDVVLYTGLGDSLYRTFGFRVSAPADLTLLSLVDGAERIPYIDMTAAGNYRINNYIPARTENQVVRGQLSFLTLTAGQSVLRANTNDSSTFTIARYPTGSTNRSRSLQINIDVLLNGVDTTAGHFQEIDLPNENTDQALRSFDAIVPLGPLHGNRSVTVTIGYRLEEFGIDQRIIFTLISAPSDVTIQIEDVATTLNYTADVVIPRSDNFVTLTDQLGNYSFTGENELLVTFQAHPNEGTINAVPAAVDANGAIEELNDVSTPIPEDSFSSVEIPDTIQFRTFSPDHFLRHSDLSELLRRRATQWCYGLALLTTVSEHAVSQAVDFLQGVVLTAPDSTRYVISVQNDGTLTTTVAP